ncbi:MAG: M20/M25/M40 family metallo-hydrolase [Myxococcales bacterium]|nr:M20/M25/M40 family metallo-hydrolase [Myxococcales bacterium]MCB9530892.1 M20/M25/M40 family metallo-hydrolase [Myxococcales bacterium]
MHIDSVLRHIDRRRLLTLLEDTVSVYSPSHAEGPVVDVFADAAAAGGLRFERISVLDSEGDEPDPPRHNLVIRIGEGPPLLTWIGHTDTVVLIEEHQLFAEVRDGCLWGLGSADMKSGCAAAVEAALALQASGIPLRGQIVVALVVGEEEYGDGCAALPDDLLAPLVVVGEPTDLRPCLRHFTYEEIHLATRGARAHAALPEHGSNAIHAMLSWALGVLEGTGRVDWPEPVAINPRTIRGGDTMFAIAEACAAELDAHLPPGTDVARVREIVQQAADETAGSHRGCEYSWEPVFSAAGYSLDEPTVVAPVRAAFERLGETWDPADFRSHSDAAALFARGCSPVVCGPGSLSVAHTVREHVPLEQLYRAAELYAAMFVAAAGASGG